jgi:ribosomal-protein-alanine N-acetyltransferase
MCALGTRTDTRRTSSKSVARITRPTHNGPTQTIIPSSTHIQSRGEYVEIVRADRLVLRDLEEANWRDVHKYASDPEVVRYMDWGPNTEDETKNFIQRSIASQKEQPRKSYTLAIVLKEDDGLIGGCGIHVSDPTNREGWIGYCLNRHFWRQGYATETARALLRFGFDQLNLHRIFALCDPENLASAHVLEKAGMQKEGHFRERKFSKGKWHDELLYAIVFRM